MPELPEVETVVRGLAAELPTRQIACVHLRRPDVVLRGAQQLTSALPGRTICTVQRRGKNILLGLDDCGPPLWLRVNLGMTGRLNLTGPSAPANGVHTHLWLELVAQPGSWVSGIMFVDPRRFGGVWLLPGPDPLVHPGLAELGPEALEITLPEFTARLTGRRPIKSLLLDQRVIAGIGNIYADECLHRAGLHPLTPTQLIPAQKQRALWKAIRAVLSAAVAAGGSTIRDYISADGRAGWFQTQHAVYGREGQPCPVCGRDVQRMVLSNRSAHFCPKCQRPPR